MVADCSEGDEAQHLDSLTKRMVYVYKKDEVE